LVNQIRDYYLTALEIGRANVNKIADPQGGLYYVYGVKELVNKQFGTSYILLVSSASLVNSQQYWPEINLFRVFWSIKPIARVMEQNKRKWHNWNCKSGNIVKC
jgi:hypothetical protein